MTLKRPVTLPQARRWPAAAARRESFCARMGGMREQLTSDRVARDPRSKINQALAAWDCDRPELLQAAHVSRGVREMKITRKMVGSEAKKNPAAKPEILAKHKDEDGRFFRLERRGEKFDVLINSTGLNWRYLSKAVSLDQALADWEKWTQQAKKNPARKPARSKAQGPSPRAQLSVRNVWAMMKKGQTTGPRWSQYARQLGYSSGKAMLDGFIARYGDPRPKKAAPRAKNPLVEIVHWSVHKPAMPPHLAIAFFSNKKDAIEAAREAAQRTGKPLAVSKHKTYHFVPEDSK